MPNDLNLGKVQSWIQETEQNHPGQLTDQEILSEIKKKATKLKTYGNVTFSHGSLIGKKVASGLTNTKERTVSQLKNLSKNFRDEQTKELWRTACDQAKGKAISGKKFIRLLNEVNDSLTVSKMGINLDKLELKPNQTKAQFYQEMIQSKQLLSTYDNQWSDATNAYLNGDISRDQMVSLTRFRKHVVDGTIDQLRNDYPSLNAKSVGSTDPTSDYDLTFSTPGSGNDVKAMREFNAAIKEQFGKQSGTVFDTNVYAKDYIGVKETVRKDEHNIRVDSDLPVPEDMGRTTAVDQDVMALMKQRRYMTANEWEKYIVSVVKDEPDVEKQISIRNQYEEAEDLYFMGLQSLADKLEIVVNDQNVETYQASLEAAVKNHEHEHPDQVLEASNSLYADRMEGIRRLQNNILDLSINDENGGNNAKIDSYKAHVYKLTGEAIFFASEAYHSKGAIKHVVSGLQGDGAELTADDLLQSFNEQFGDFLKDFNHYSDNEEKLFVKSSKYLFRLFDAANQLDDLGLPQKYGDTENLNVLIKNTLYAMRKGSLKFDNAEEVEALSKALDSKLAKSLPKEIRKELIANVLIAQEHFNENPNDKFSTEFSGFDAKAITKSLFGVENAEQFRDYVIELGRDFNISAREQIPLKVDDQSFRKFFENNPR